MFSFSYPLSFVSFWTASPSCRFGSQSFLPGDLEKLFGSSTEIQSVLSQHSVSLWESPQHSLPNEALWCVSIDVSNDFLKSALTFYLLKSACAHGNCKFAGIKQGWDSQKCMCCNLHRTFWQRRCRQFCLARLKAQKSKHCLKLMPPLAPMTSDKGFHYQYPSKTVHTLNY